MSYTMWTGRKVFDAIRVLDAEITMRDGVKLAARVYLPKEDGKFPALYVPSAYQIASDTCPASDLYLTYEIGPMEWYVREHGYAFVRLDVRGSGRSEGEYTFWSSIEQKDHAEAIAWIAAQEWSNGKVGGFGQSYYGVAQWFAAAQKPPALACIAPFDAHTDPYTDGWYHGGIPSGFSAVWYELNVRMQNFYRNGGDNSGRYIGYDAVGDWMQHYTRDEYWKERSPQELLDKIDIPVLSIGMWGKRSLHLRGNIRGYEGVKEPKWLLIDSCRNVFEAHHYFHETTLHQRVLLPFYDRYLKGVDNGFEKSRPKVETWVYGRDEYVSWPSWPPAADRVDYFLNAEKSGSVTSLNDGGLASAPPAESDTPCTAYSYPDPEWRIGNAKLGPKGPDLIARNITFTSEPLAKDLELVGHPTTTLYISSDQPDTDFIITISDQGPSPKGSSDQPPYAVISRGWLRASHRALDETIATEERPFHRHEAPEPIVPGKIYKLDIEMSACGYRVPKGHRLRVEISPTDSSIDEGPFAHHYSWQRVGTDSIHHSPKYPSHVTVPVVKTG